MKAWRSIDLVTDLQLAVCLIFVFYISSFSILGFLKVASRFQIWKKKTFCQNSDKFGYSFIKNDIWKK